MSDLFLLEEFIKEALLDEAKRKSKKAKKKRAKKKAASKRFKLRGSGSIKRAHATKRHILTKRTTKNCFYHGNKNKCQKTSFSYSAADRKSY